MSPIPPIFRWPLELCGGLSAACYVLSIITGNLSQVDRIWTFAPVVYTAYFALLPLWPKQASGYFYPYTPEGVHKYVEASFSPRALMMLGLQTLWMFRLSYNTWRRGLFNLHEEDYRWEVLRQKLPGWLLQITNLTFIAFIQNVLLFLLGVPASIAATQPHTALSTSDYIFAGASLLTLYAEFTADNQQYAFQTFKHEGRSARASQWPGARLTFTPADRKRGFITRGLWAWSRHPNFFCEQTFWVLQTLIPLVAPPAPHLSKAARIPRSVHELTPLWPLTPALALCSLFIASTWFTESISMGKYPEKYGAYRRRVAMFDPIKTVLKGLLLNAQGDKEKVETLVYGQAEEDVPGSLIYGGAEGKKLQ